MMESPFMSMKEIGAYLNLSSATIYRLKDEGAFPVYKFGTAYRARRAEIEEWIKGQRATRHKTGTIQKSGLEVIENTGTKAPENALLEPFRKG